MSQHQQKRVTSSSSTEMTIHSLTECLHRIHALEGSANQSALVMEALGLVELLKENQLKAMPLSVQQRALKLSDCQRRQESCTEFAFLFGRCFNLSMNAKIMNQCNHSDANIATRLLTDFQVLTSSLNAKLHNHNPYCDTLAALNINA
jgi:hypothetical protein